MYLNYGGIRMKKRNLLVLPLVALFASCSPKAPAVYDTNVNLPSGGEAVSEEEKDTKAASTLEETLGGLADLKKFSLGGEISIDFSGSTKSQYSDYVFNETTGNYDQVEMSSNTDFSFKGKLKFSIMHDETIEMPEEETPTYVSKLSLVFDGLNIRFNEKINGVARQAVSADGLTFGVHYAYDKRNEKGRFLADLSHPSFKAFAIQAVNSIVDQRSETSEREKAATKLVIAQVLESFLVAQGGKFFADQDELIAKIKELAAPSSSELEPEGLLPFRAEDPSPLDMLSTLLEGDIVSNVVGMLSTYLPEQSSLESMVPSILEALPFLFNQYKNDAGEVVQYGLGFNLDKNNAGEFIAMIMSMMNPTSSGVDSGTPISGMPVPTGESGIPDNVDFALGFAMMLGKTHGSQNIALESVNLKVRVSVTGSVSVQGAFGLELFYGEQVSDLVGDPARYTIDAIELIEALNPKPTENQGE